MQGRTWTTALALLLLTSAVTSADAQSRGGGGRGGGKHKTQDSPAQEQPTDQPAAPPPAAATISWPWLDKGSVICGTREDMVAYQELFELPRNERMEKPQPKCDYVEKRTGIRIINHDGPSRTQISTNEDPQQMGWTNTFLPDDAPRN